MSQNIAIGKTLSFYDKEIRKLTQNVPLESFIQETPKKELVNQVLS